MFALYKWLPNLKIYVISKRDWVLFVSTKDVFFVCLNQLKRS